MLDLGDGLRVRLGTAAGQVQGRDSARARIRCIGEQVTTTLKAGVPRKLRRSPDRTTDVAKAAPPSPHPIARAERFLSISGWNWTSRKYTGLTGSGANSAPDRALDRQGTS
ncbi:hypothetical protein ACWV2X_23130 [Streptomyces hydrogenans]